MARRKVVARPAQMYITCPYCHEHSDYDGSNFPEGYAELQCGHKVNVEGYEV